MTDASANAIVNTAALGGALSMGLSEAAAKFRGEVSNTRVVTVAMSPSDEDKLRVRLGDSLPVQMRAKGKVATIHPVDAVERALCRKELVGRWDPNDTTQKVLLMGCSGANELRAYGHLTHVHFNFHRPATAADALRRTNDLGAKFLDIAAEYLSENERGLALLMAQAEDESAGITPRQRWRQQMAADGVQEVSFAKWQKERDDSRLAIYREAFDADEIRWVTPGGNEVRPNLLSKKPKTVKKGWAAAYPSIEAAMQRSIPDGGSRIHVGTVTDCDLLIYLDSAYDAGVKGIAKTMHITGASRCLAMGALPPELTHGPEAVAGHDDYEIRFDKAGGVEYSLGDGKDYTHQAKVWHSAFCQPVATFKNTQIVAEPKDKVGHHVVMEYALAATSGKQVFTYRLPERLRNVQIIDVKRTFLNCVGTGSAFKPIWAYVPHEAYHAVARWAFSVKEEQVTIEQIAAQIRRVALGTYTATGERSTPPFELTTNQFQAMVGNLFVSRVLEKDRYSRAIGRAVGECKKGLWAQLGLWVSNIGAKLADFLLFWRKDLDKVQWYENMDRDRTYRAYTVAANRYGTPYREPRPQLHQGSAEMKLLLQRAKVLRDRRVLQEADDYQHKPRPDCDFCETHAKEFGDQRVTCRFEKNSFMKLTWTDELRRIVIEGLDKGITDAEAEGKGDLAAAVRKYKVEAAEKIVVGDTCEMRVEYTSGCAGSGKSRFARLQYKRDHINIAPTRALDTEVKNSKHPITGVRSGIKSATIHKTYTLPEAEIGYVDECHMQQMGLVFVACFLKQLKTLRMLGDEEQTHLRDIEGIPLNTLRQHAAAEDPWIELSPSFSTHHLNKSFRIARNHAVAVCALVEGYKMDTHRLDDGDATIYTLDQFVASDDKTMPVLTFCKEVPALNGSNLAGTVRAQQGYEYDVNAIYFGSDGDLRLWNNASGQKVVALTRHKKRLIFIYNPEHQGCKAEAEKCYELFKKSSTELGLDQPTAAAMMVNPGLHLGLTATKAWDEANEARGHYAKLVARQERQLRLRPTGYCPRKSHHVQAVLLRLSNGPKRAGYTVVKQPEGTRDCFFESLRKLVPSRADHGTRAMKDEVMQALEDLADEEDDIDEEPLYKLAEAVGGTGSHAMLQHLVPEAMPFLVFAVNRAGKTKIIYEQALGDHDLHDGFRRLPPGIKVMMYTSNGRNVGHYEALEPMASYFTKAAAQVTKAKTAINELRQARRDLRRQARGEQAAELAQAGAGDAAAEPDELLLTGAGLLPGNGNIGGAMLAVARYRDMQAAPTQASFTDPGFALEVGGGVYHTDMVRGPRMASFIEPARYDTPVSRFGDFSAAAELLCPGTPDPFSVRGEVLGHFLITDARGKVVQGGGLRASLDALTGAGRNRRGNLLPDPAPYRTLAQNAQGLTRLAGAPMHEMACVQSRYVPKVVRISAIQDARRKVLTDKMWDHHVLTWYVPQAQMKYLTEGMVADELRAACDDMRSRHYEERALGEEHCRPRNHMRMVVKDQFKGSFGDPDFAKPGQGIMSAAARFLMHMLPIMRALHNVECENRQSDILSEHRVQGFEFEDAHTAACRALLPGSNILGGDVKQMDSSQSAYTLEFEKRRAALFRMPPTPEYWEQRENVIVRGNVVALNAKAVKCTGEPGTLSGNELLTSVMFGWCVTYSRCCPSVRTIKGDDMSFAGYNVSVDWKRAAELKELFGFTLKFDFGPQIHWCAYVLGVRGAVPNLRRRMLKAMGKPIHSALGFLQYQASFVDLLNAVARYPIARMAMAEYYLMRSDGMKDATIRQATMRVESWLTAIHDVATWTHEQFMEHSFTKAPQVFQSHGHGRKILARLMGRRTGDEAVGLAWQKPDRKAAAVQPYLRVFEWQEDQMQH